MRRGPNQTRYFLEIPGTDTTADWPEQRARGELTARLGVGGQLADVPLVEFGLLDMRVRMIEPTQQGRLVLAGVRLTTATTSSVSGFGITAPKPSSGSKMK